MPAFHPLSNPTLATSIAFGLVLLGAAPAFADIVHLTNGNWFKGVVIEESDERIVVATTSGEIPLRWNVVDRVERGSKDENLELLVEAALRTDNAPKALSLLSDAILTFDSDAPTRILQGNEREIMAAVRRMPRDLSPEVRILITRMGASDRVPPRARVQLARLMAELEAPIEASDLLMTAGVDYLATETESGGWARTFLNRTIRRLIYENRSTEAVEQLERLRLIDAELAGMAAEPMIAVATAARARDRKDFEKALQILDQELAPEYPALADNRTSHVLRRLLAWAERENREDDAHEWVRRWVENRMPLEALSARQALTASMARTYLRNADPSGALAVIEELPQRQWNDELEIVWKRAKFEADKRILDETNPADLFQLALWAAEHDLVPEAINLLQRIRVNPMLREAADKQTEQLKHDRDVDILQRAVEAFDEGLMEKVVQICGEMELDEGRQSPVQKQAQDLAALARRRIILDQEKRPYIAEAHYQEAERAFWLDNLDESWKLLDTILAQYPETPAAGRAVQLLPEVARALELEMLEGRRFKLPDTARVETVLSARSTDDLGEEIRRMVDMPLIGQ